ncbi:MAG: TatD family hydrolase [Nanoarchaeota archaeon]|nr:TatD family hydrolase [Nanoarchaeota archaeon]
MKTCYIDIHCHLEMCKDITECVKNAHKRDVGLILTQGTSVETNREALKLAEKYKEVKACLGIYPIDALKMSDKEIKKEIDFIRNNKNKIVAIGEVGIDFKEDSENHERQKEIFRNFVELSMEINKPIIIHSRKAEEDCIEILEKMNAKKVIMHCFCGKRKLVERIVKNGWYLTIPTSVKNGQQFQDNAKIVPIEQLFCETDSPFLHPDKKENNEPGNVVVSYEKISEIKGMKLGEVKDKIFENYLKLFET